MLPLQAAVRLFRLQAPHVSLEQKAFPDYLHFISFTNLLASVWLINLCFVFS